MMVTPDEEVDITQGAPFFLDPASAGDVSVYATIELPESEKETYLPYKMKTLQDYDNQKNVVINGGETFTYTMAFSAANGNAIPCTYNHGDIQIQYTVNETGDEDSNFDLTWNCEASCVFPTTFTNTSLITDGTWVESDNSDVDVSNVTKGTTFIQRFYMQAYPKPQPDDGSGLFPSTTLTFSVKNNLTEFASFSNIITKAAIFYYDDFASHSNSSSYFEITDAGVVNAGISGYTNVTNVIAHYLTIQQYISPITGHFATVALPMENSLTKVSDDFWSRDLSGNLGLRPDDVQYYKDHKTDSHYYAEIIGTPENTNVSLATSKYKLNYTTVWSQTTGYIAEWRCHIQPVGITFEELSEYVSGVRLFGIFRTFTAMPQHVGWYTAAWYSNALSEMAQTMCQEACNAWGTKYCSLVFTNTDGESEGDDAKRTAYIKVNDFDEWIPIFDGEDITFSQNFEFATGDVVASNDIFNFGYKKLNTILVKSDKEYDISIKVSHNVYKGVYTDLNDEMEELYNQGS